MNFFGLFRRRPPIRDLAALAQFIDENAAFLVQKGIYEYARARAGRQSHLLFREQAFLELVEKSRWQAYPLGLAMVGEMIQGILEGPERGRASTLNPLKSLILEVFDRYPAPVALGLPAWNELRRNLDNRLNLIAIHPPKLVKDIPEPFAETYFSLMPIHKSLRGHDFPAMRNHLKASLCNIHDELTQRLDRDAVVLQLVSKKMIQREKMAVSNATPLLALDLVALDTETTALDPNAARILEIGAVRMRGPQIDAANPFRCLVNPGVSIPTASTCVHKIDDAAVAQAPGFPAVWPELIDFIGESVVIGHTFGFDLAVLKRECQRAGLPWEQPRTLDTRLLAEVAEPHLAGYSLEGLAAWLNIAVTGRHSALGDAITTARIFAGLIPKLRERGIRTLAEAEQACRGLSSLLDDQHRAGWVEPVAPPSRADSERTLKKIDSYPYRHRIKDAMSSPVRRIDPGETISTALERMTRERVSSIVVVPNDVLRLRPEDTGIVTERDIMRALASYGAGALTLPCGKIMNKPLAVVPQDAFIYRAIGRMGRLRIRHLGTVDDDGFVVGALSARDLLRLRAQDAVQLGDEIDDAADVPSLARAWAKLSQVARALIDEGVSSRDIAAVISRELGALTRRTAILAERHMADIGRGASPCPYAFAILGSAGRGESLLAMDQDNALVFAEGQPGGLEDRWFAELATHVADYLHQVGVPYCAGGVMAKNPQWRGSVATWERRVAEWIGRSNPCDLLSVDIFFDLRAVHGDATLANAVWRHGYDAADGQAAFAKLLAEVAGSVEPGLGMFGGFRTDKGRIDLKKTGLFGIVTAARVLTIRHHIVERSTAARLAGLKTLGLGAAQDLEALDQAHLTFLSFILDQQIDDVERGRPASNTVQVRRLRESDKARLRTAFRSVQHLDGLTRDLLFKP